MLDLESEQLADSILKAIRAAGTWDTRASKTAAVTFSGIRIIPYGDSAQQAGETLGMIFREAKIDFGTDNVPINQCGDQTTPAVYIWVGKK